MKDGEKINFTKLARDFHLLNQSGKRLLLYPRFVKNNFQDGWYSSFFSTSGKSPANGGQVVKEILSLNGCDLERFEYLPGSGERIRRMKRRYFNYLYLSYSTHVKVI